jgi:hypothetical protein
MSNDGHGFDTRGDPRFAVRRAAADAQREFSQAKAAADQARDRDELAADDDIAIERALTAARRARS